MIYLKINIWIIFGDKSFKDGFYIVETFFCYIILYLFIDL